MADEEGSGNLRAKAIAEARSMIRWLGKTAVLFVFALAAIWATEYVAYRDMDKKLFAEEQGMFTEVAAMSGDSITAGQLARTLADIADVCEDDVRRKPRIAMTDAESAKWEAVLKADGSARAGLAGAEYMAGGGWEHLYTDVRKARAAALMTKRPLFVIFTAGWCPACVKLQRDMQEDDEILRILRDRYAVAYIEYETDAAKPQRENAKRCGYPRARPKLPTIVIQRLAD